MKNIKERAEKYLRNWNTPSTSLIRDLLVEVARLESKLSNANTAEIFVIADIREALGVGHKPMLSELPGICREMREYSDRMEACNASLQSQADAGQHTAMKLKIALSEIDRLTEGRSEAINRKAGLKEALVMAEYVGTLEWVDRHTVAEIIDAIRQRIEATP
jgi:hypothetical protein